MQPYASFLVRCWCLATGERRVKIEHIQSGEAFQAATLEDAVDWLSRRLDQGCVRPAPEVVSAAVADRSEEREAGGV